VHLTYACHQLNTQHQHHPAPSYSQSCWRIKSLRRRMAGASLLSNNGPGEPEEIWGAPSLKWAPPHNMGNGWKRYQFLSGARSKLYTRYPRILMNEPSPKVMQNPQLKQWLWRWRMEPRMSPTSSFLLFHPVSTKSNQHIDKIWSTYIDHNNVIIK
jgi:hypothetical protein